MQVHIIKYILAAGAADLHEGGNMMHHTKEDRDDGCRAPFRAARQRRRQDLACLADQVGPQGRQAIEVDLLQQLRCG